MALEIDTILPPAPPPNFTRRLSTTCELHPDETVTGFCASCLRERLAGLESSAASSAPGRKSTSALKSLLFKIPSSNSSSSFLRPDLRRCKSFSCGRGDGFAAAAPGGASAFEPQRHSCDVRGRNTLWSLFHQDDRERVRDGTTLDAFPASSAAAAAAVSGEIEAEHSGLILAPPCVIETREEDEEEELEEIEEDEIRSVDPVLVLGTSGEIEELAKPEMEETKESMEVLPMKDHIDLESEQKKPATKDLKEIAGSFWLAASVFSKKWQKWRRKQKLKKQCSSSSSKAAAAAMPLPENPPKPSFLRLRRRRSRESDLAAGETLGRRSCDTDPRFSLDAGRMSIDDPTFSWDEPRASWDGYLIGAGRSVLSRPLPMLSVLEDAPIPSVPRSDGQIPVEFDSAPAGGAVPGGSAETQDYYADSSNRQRRSFERSNSMRRPSFSLETHEPKISPPPAAGGGSEFYHFHHAGSFLDREFSSTSLKDDYSFSFEPAFQDIRKNNPLKKARKWSKAWSILAFIHRRGNNRNGAHIVGRSFSECNGAKIMRSNSRSSVSSRSSFSGNGSLGSSRRNGTERNGLERNRSARYSPGRVENGMLRFYLTPMRNSRRNGVAGKGRHVSSQLFARSIVGLY